MTGGVFWGGPLRWRSVFMQAFCKTTSKSTPHTDSLQTSHPTSLVAENRGGFDATLTPPPP